LGLDLGGGVPCVLLAGGLVALEAAVRGLPPPWNDKERHLRWMELLWDQHQISTREERRKEEVLDTFKHLVELSKRRLEAPHFPSGESPW
jgi:hypothetical protein